MDNFSEASIGASTFGLEKQQGPALSPISGDKHAACCGPLQKPFGFVIGDFGAAVEAAVLTQTDTLSNAQQVAPYPHRIIIARHRPCPITHNLLRRLPMQ